MRNVAAFIFALLMPLGAWAEASNSSSSFDKLEFGTRLGAGLMYVITDSEKDYYPSNGGPWGSLSFDVAYGLTENLYLHSGVGLDYRIFFVYIEALAGDVLDYDVGEEQDAYDKCEGSVYCGREHWEYNQTFLLNIPVLLQWRIPHILFFEAGIVFDLLLGTIENQDDGWRGEPYRNRDEESRLGVNVAMGIGHQFKSGLFIDFRTLFRVNDLIDADKFADSYFIPVQEFDGDGNVVFDFMDYSEPYGSYYKMLKFQLGVGYWF